MILQQTSRSSHFYTILSLILVLIMDSMVMGIVFPLMGALFISSDQAIVSPHTTLWMRDILYSLTMGVFFFCVIIGAPFLGDLSDIIGRRKVLLISLGIGAASCFLAALAIFYKWVWLLIAARAIAGLASGNQPLAQAAMIDISTPENKARNIGLITLASCAGFVLGPLVGGIFSDHHWLPFLSPAVPFVIAGILALITATGVWFTFKETFAPSDHKALNIGKGFTLLIDGFRHLRLRYWIWVFLFAQLGWGIYFQSISLILAQHFHYTTGKIGIFMMWVAFLFAFFLGAVVPRALKSYSHRGLLLSGFMIAIVTVLIELIFVRSALTQWLCAAPFVLGQAFIYTLTMTLISNTVDKNSQGWAMGVAAAVGSLAWGIAAFAAGSVNASLYLPFVLALILFSVCYCMTGRHQ